MLQVYCRCERSSEFQVGLVRSQRTRRGYSQSPAQTTSGESDTAIDSVLTPSPKHMASYDTYYSELY